MTVAETEGAAHALATYEPLARFYDLFTRHDDYPRWCALLDGLLRRHGVTGRRLLDVACGTGKSTTAFRDLGYQVSGIDLSAAMIAEARAKEANRGISFQQGDMRSLPGPGSDHDVVLCMDDAVNNLLSAAELGSALAGTARALHPGGLLLFDVNTTRTYRSWYASDEVTHEPDTVFVWQGHCSPDHPAGGLARADLTVFARDGAGPLWRRSDAPHVQRHHPEPLLRAALRSAGLDVLGVLGMRPGTAAVDDTLDEERHHKAIVIARRPLTG
ncbi:class I SAM-dependent methyltransferase [Streptomyces sp. ASQP_92]|uniref:class I SAM-dependent DNA methyltransferase n=1 Tax=Streptomyces sp. ASQP_92 TaxID=2979116 RepID=UPI0021BED24A|nr:class I SAM-dependent methyltransferase [Streptomyces sp. ASQP_92]MCT9093833.1 class I SAM-dependent methyltransferase [Streptomyces sp. ASQP_92]